jgi:hypothetical protein
MGSAFIFGDPEIFGFAAVDGLSGKLGRVVDAAGKSLADRVS